MIRIERGAAPGVVGTPEFQAARADYLSFRLGGGSRTMQTKADPLASLHQIEAIVGGAVSDMFRGKCAYTETRDENARFHLHRPEADAYDEQLGISAEHYWWTATWPGNWLLASNLVASLKRNNFPVIGERGVAPGSEVLDAAWEPSGRHLDRGELLDPCNDRPEWHLLFGSDGSVRAWGEADSAFWLDDDDEARRGPVTIRLLHLDDPQLVLRRQAFIARAVGRFGTTGELTTDDLDVGQEHIGAIRQALATVALDRGWSSGPAVDELMPEIAPQVAAAPGRHPSELVQRVASHVRRFDQRLARRFARAQVAVTSPAPVEAPPLPTPAPTRAIPRTAAITRVRIKNFQAIEHVDFTIDSEEVALAVEPPPPTAVFGRHWKVLLGENGSGKTATLRAIAVALAGSDLDELVELAGIEWGRFLRRGTTQGRVVLDFTDGSRVDLRFNKRRGWFVGGAPTVEGFVRGFGATRLMAPGTRPAEANVRLGNLFDPRVPVVDAERWLLDIPDDGDFNVAAVALAELIGREDVVTGSEPDAPQFVERSSGRITVDGEPLANLSEGYRSVIATACDLMAGAGAGLSAMANATGIVLIDEIGAHMHPKWRMDITRKLRQVFPSMQFIVSTHEPLCLLGVLENEVIRVRPSSTAVGKPWHSIFDPIAESPSRYRVDRLLTSEFFGLDTTIDPVVDRKFREYYSLVRDATLDPVRAERMRQLRRELSHFGVLGYTRRDQLVYEAIDEFLAREPQLDPEERRRVRKETLAKVGDIWRNVAERRRLGNRP